PETFTLPRLNGPVAVDWTATGARIRIGGIENPRDLANLSGLLVLELWALSTDYSGGSFTGMPLGGAELGALAGQVSWNNIDFELSLAAHPAAGTHVILMLREWTAAGYITRDFVNVAAPTAQPVAAPVSSPAAKAATTSQPTSAAVAKPAAATTPA